VIDRADIERLQARSVPDLLRGVQGLQVSNSGGAGKVTSCISEAPRRITYWF